MKYSLIFFFILFSINNLLHLVSEKVVIVIFITFLYFLIKFVSTLIQADFKARIEQIMSDVNMYMNAMFNFLYINKLIYINYRLFIGSFRTLTEILIRKVSKLTASTYFNKAFTNIVKL